jgi:hypothetical protein
MAYPAALGGGTPLLGLAAFGWGLWRRRRSTRADTRRVR